jgi:hypothetical protein
MKGLALILGAKPKGKEAPSSSPDMEGEEEAPESESSEQDEYKKEMASAAADGDWDGFADAVAGLVRCCMK